MTSYKKSGRRPLLRRVVWRIVSNKHINYFLVPILQYLPASQLSSKIPVVGRTAELKLADHKSIYLQQPDRCQVAKEIFWGGGALHKASDRLALNAAIILSADAEIFLDIGSYTGLFALAVAKSNNSVIAYAYEIVPENYLLIWRNILANDLVGRVVPRLIGLGEAKSEIRIPLSLGEGTLASSVALDAVETAGVKIPIESLDTQHGAFRGRAVLKIDVETFEWPVLSGGNTFLTRNRPDIVCEILRRAPHISAIENFLRENDYRMYHITKEGLRISSAIVPAVGERDWLFTTRSPSELGALELKVLPA